MGRMIHLCGNCGPLKYLAVMNKYVKLALQVLSYLLAIAAGGTGSWLMQ